jgi:hypothetical protein
MADPHCANLWAITCYFNPVGYRRRLENYRLFRQRLKVPLVAVELSFNNRFQLSSTDAEVLVQLHSPSVLWQKERLLNVALQSLPKACDKVAWLDCDVLFENDDWAEGTERGLDEFALLHLFHDRNELPMDFRPDAPNWIVSLKSQSVIHRLALGEITPRDASLTGGPLRGFASGLAWASRRDLLERHGLYDACILGSGDKAILSAALGTFADFTRARYLSPRSTEHYLEWANSYYNGIHGRIGYIHGSIFHLWHGDLHNRRSLQQLHLFAQFDFDPYTDIVVDQNGCWRWNSDKTGMHAFVKHYFESRKEDGPKRSR